MVYWRETIILFLFLLKLLLLTLAQDYQYKLCVEESGFYSSNSTYQKNRDSLLFSLAPKTDQYGYYSSSVGENPDKVNAMVLCRGDIVSNLTACRSCINSTTNMLKQECFTFKEALGGSDKCLLFYTSKNLNGIVDSPTNYMYNPDQNVPSVDQFNRALGTLLVRLQDVAASGGSLRKFAAGNTTLPGSISIYAYVQCTPVLSEKQCRDCLERASGEIKNCCNERAGGRVVRPSCNLRYEVTRFIEADNMIQVNASMASSGKGNRKTRTVVIAVVPTVASLTVLIIGISTVFRRRPQNDVQKLEVDDVSNTDDKITEDSLQYDFGIISEATDNFSDANKLGQGGFGAVYKGKLPNGREVAIKRLAQGSAYARVESEFKNEVKLVIKLQHRNLVRLLGFSLQGTERLLIYELVANSSLDKILFDPTKREQLEWDTRYKIIAGVARGILYLHEDSRLRIIHRDLKASNILLDTDMNPKISDFGTARLFDLDQTHGVTKNIAGTYGYMSPEYARHGRFSVKSDVFSFGVLVLEIVTGEKINSFRNGEDIEHLLSYAWKSWREGKALSLIDPVLKAGDTRAIHEIMKCIHVGLLCVQESVAARPAMASVVVMLNSSSVTLMAPLQPGFYMYSKTNPELPSIKHYRTYSGDNDPITELVPR